MKDYLLVHETLTSGYTTEENVFPPPGSNRGKSRVSDKPHPIPLDDGIFMVQSCSGFVQVITASE